MARTITVISFPSAGMHAERDPIAVPQDGYAMGVNVRLEKQSLAQRHGYREIPLNCPELEALNLQGAINYVPSSGQSALQFASKGEYILIAAGGKKFTIEVLGRGVSTYTKVVDVTGGLTQPADLHQIWLAQAENYAIAGDDFAATWIYDSVNPAYASPGYIATGANREESRVPNRMRLPLYTNGRLAVVTDDRSIQIGDIIHGSNLTDASDLLKFVEQTYWAEGQKFVLPSNVGPIYATYNLPTTGDSNDHGDAVFESSHGTYAIATDVYPRTSWADTRMVRFVSAEGAAQGQFAHDEFDNDSVRRTLQGVQALSFTQQRGDKLRAPQELLSEQVDDYLRGDNRPFLRFNSTKFHRQVKRLYTTVRPWLSGYHWQHRGLMSFNYKKKVWEGLWTCPKEFPNLKMLVPMRLAGDERMFMICGDAGNVDSIKLIEVEPNLRYDVLADGTKKPIMSSVEARTVYENLEERYEIQNGCLQFSNVEGDVSYEILFKQDGSEGCWKEWQSGSFCVKPYNHPGVKTIQLQEFPGDPSVQTRFLIKWTGPAELRFLNIEVNDFAAPHSVESDCESCVEDPVCCTFDEFEYSM